MSMRMWCVGLMMMLAAAVSPASAQRGEGSWEFLGQKAGGFGVEGDSIYIQQNEDWHRDRAYRRLRFTAEGNDVRLIGLRLAYLNGHQEDVAIQRDIPRGGSVIVDLPGERSYLQRIDMRYRSGVGVSFGSGGLRLAQGSVTVHGERIVRREPTPVSFEGGRGGWVEIDRQSFDRTSDRVELRGQRGDGRFGQIKLRAGDRMDVRSVNVRFRNGETQHIRVDQRLEPGEDTRALDLEGDLRGIDRVMVSMEPRRRPGSSDITLFGVARPGNERDRDDRYAARGWQLLGEQTVGFSVDRDEIVVNQNEDWHRTKRFRTLHFVPAGNDVHMMQIRLVYMNGFAEDFRVDRLLPQGSEYALDLRGDRSFIRKIEMTYRSRPNFNGRATMRVFGESRR